MKSDWADLPALAGACNPAGQNPTSPIVPLADCWDDGRSAQADLSYNR
ncbi:hypothetical protein [Burkholderia orbicola]